jgi:hypothetical protein
MNDPEERALIPAASLAVFGRNWLWWLLVGLVFVVGLAVRLYDLSDPPLDFHPTRQIHSALIARGMYYQQHPDIPEWQREIAVAHWQMEGLIEPQVFERITVWTYQLAGVPDLRIPRLYAILFWMAAAVFVVWLAVQIAGWGGGVIAALVFLIWPYGVIASRSFQPEPLMVLLLSAAFWAALRWQWAAEQGRLSWVWAIAAGLLSGMAICIKSVAVFFVAPALAALVLSIGLRRAARAPQVWAIGVLAVLPYTFYLIDGLFLRGFLVSQFSQRFFPQMWLDPAFYLRWISNLERVFPFEMVLLAFLGTFLVRRSVYRWLLLALWAGYFVYGMTLPHHISTHDYYHLPLFLPVALGLAAAAELVFRHLRGPAWVVRVVTFAVLAAALVINAYSARNTLKRFDAAALASDWYAVGQELGPHASVLALVDDYGSGLKYWGWLTPRLWLTEEERRWRDEPLTREAFSDYFAGQADGRDFFIAQRAELSRQPVLELFLYRRYPVYFEVPGSVIFDLRPTVGEGTP